MKRKQFKISLTSNAAVLLSNNLRDHFKSEYQRRTPGNFQNFPLRYMINRFEKIMNIALKENKGNTGISEHV